MLARRRFVGYSTLSSSMLANPPLLRSGFDGAGNITAYYDSTSGQWNNIQYDAVNRLVSAAVTPAVTSGLPYYCWSYDSFGNRLSQNNSSAALTVGAGTCTAAGGSTTSTNTQSYATNNRLSSTTLPSGSFSYDSVGDVSSDSANSYAYDAEGRQCAVEVGERLARPMPMYTTYAYVYDAEGRRVAEASECLIH